MKPTDLAQVEFLWIGEIDPDLFSWWIQYILSLKTQSSPREKMKLAIAMMILRRKMPVDYSHCAVRFLYTGKVWHATTPGGVREDSYEDATRDSIVRHSKVVQLNITNEAFSAWLETERGKAYSMRQNAFALIPFLKPIQINGDRSRHCSEFAAKVAFFTDEYRFPVHADLVWPTCVHRVIVLELPY